MAADVEAGARCEWEEDDWRSLWRYRGLATAIMMPPAARTSTGNTVMQTHLATDTSSSLPILQGEFTAREFLDAYCPYCESYSGNADIIAPKLVKRRNT